MDGLDRLVAKEVCGIVVLALCLGWDAVAGTPDG